MPALPRTPEGVRAAGFAAASLSPPSPGLGSHSLHGDGAPLFPFASGREAWIFCREALACWHPRSLLLGARLDGADPQKKKGSSERQPAHWILAGESTP